MATQELHTVPLLKINNPKGGKKDALEALAAKMHANFAIVSNYFLKFLFANKQM